MRFTKEQIEPLLREGLGHQKIAQRLGGKLNDVANSMCRLWPEHDGKITEIRKVMGIPNLDRRRVGQENAKLVGDSRWGHVSFTDRQVAMRKVVEASVASRRNALERKQEEMRREMLLDSVGGIKRRPYRHTSITKEQIVPLLELSGDEIARRLKVPIGSLAYVMKEYWPETKGSLRQVRVLEGLAKSSHKPRKPLFSPESIAPDGGRCCPTCHRDWKPPANREERLQGRLDAVDNELRSCKFPLSLVPEQLWLFPVSIRDRLHMDALAKTFIESLTPEQKADPAGQPPKKRGRKSRNEKVVDSGGDSLWKENKQVERMRLLNYPADTSYWDAKKKEIAGGSSDLHSRFQTGRPNLPLPVRIVTAEELARM